MHRINPEQVALGQRYRALMSGPPKGRPIEELIRTRDQLKGHESQRLRSYFSTQSLQPARDLDVHGQLILAGDLPTLQADYESRLPFTPASDIAAQIAAKRWGPTDCPLYNLILLSTTFLPAAREQHLAIARWYINTVKVPVDGVDLSGTTALSHALSTKPAFDPEFAEILLGGLGANVNARNRYGETCAHDAVKLPPTASKADRTKAGQAIEWFLGHDGNIDIADTDGFTPRGALWFEEVWKVVEKEDRRRQDVDGCAFCGRAGELMRCTRCKKAKYCPKPRGCNVGDWARHKRVCKTT